MWHKQKQHLAHKHYSVCFCSDLIYTFQTQIYLKPDYKYILKKPRFDVSTSRKQAVIIYVFFFNTQGNVCQRKNKEAIFDLIQQTELQQKRPILSSLYIPICPKTYSVDLQTSINPIIIVLNAHRPSKDCIKQAEVHALNPNKTAINLSNVRIRKRINNTGK